jgi:hypothetical protein
MVPTFSSTGRLLKAFGTINRDILECPSFVYDYLVYSQAFILKLSRQHLATSLPQESRRVSALGFCLIAVL